MSLTRVPAGPRAPLRALVLATLVAASAMGGGCAKGTYLEVHFTGPATLPDILGISVDLTLTAPTDAGTRHSNDIIRREGADPKIELPTSAAFKLDGKSGNLFIDARALGAQDLPLASAAKSTRIVPGETWSVVLNFVALPDAQ